MKNLFKIALVSAGVFMAGQSFAQGHEEHTSVGHKMGSAATDVGHKTAEVAVKGTVAITDKRYKDHYAPTGELIYIDKDAKYFYVDKRGHREYITKMHMRYKPKH